MLCIVDDRTASVLSASVAMGAPAGFNCGAYHPVPGGKPGGRHRYATQIRKRLSGVGRFSDKGYSRQSEMCPKGALIKLTANRHCTPQMSLRVWGHLAEWVCVS
jgi:hypothetical protein